MSLEMECHLKYNVTQTGISLKMEYQSQWNATENGKSLQNAMSLKII